MENSLNKKLGKLYEPRDGYTILRNLRLRPYDPSYVPPKHDELSGDSNSSKSEEDSKLVNPQSDVKFLVFTKYMDKSIVLLIYYQRIRQ